MGLQKVQKGKKRAIGGHPAPNKLKKHMKADERSFSTFSQQSSTEYFRGRYCVVLELRSLVVGSPGVELLR